MISVHIDGVENKLKLEHSLYCDQHLIDELTKVLDIIISDLYLKVDRKNINKTLNVKEEILLKKRKQVLEEMMKLDCTCRDYLSTEENSTKIYICENCDKKKCNEC